MLIYFMELVVQKARCILKLIQRTVLPTQLPLRRLPIGVRDQVATELRRLESMNIITPMTEPASWVSALLVVTKANG